MKLSEYLMRSLKQRGIKRVYGVPGRENAHILFNEVEDISFITTRVEFNAGIMADFTARITQTPQVAFCTMGPGATNMVTAVSSSMLNRSPMLLISAQLESDDRYYNITHQCVDQRSIFDPVTKASIELNHAYELPAVLDQAFELMMKEPVGPVHISVPTDFWTQEIGQDDKSFDEIPAVVTWPETPISNQLINELHVAITKGKRALCLVGNEVIRSGAESEIRDFCRAWHIPLLASANAKGILDYEDELNIGSASCYMEGILQYPTALAELFDDIDLIINIGYQYVDDILPKMWNRGCGKTVVNISAFSVKLINAKYAPDLEVVGNIKKVMKSLSELSTECKEHISLEKLKGKIDAAYMQTREDEKVTPVEVIKIINENLEGGTFVTDIGYYRHHAILFSRPERTNQFFTDAGLSSFGCGLPSAAAAQFLDRSKPVFLLCGDGGFHSGSCDLETLVRHKLPVVIIVQNNSAYELIQRYQHRGGQGNNQEILSFNGVDFTKLAEANGVPSAFAKDSGTLCKLIKNRDRARPLLIEVPLAYHSNDEFKESF